MKEIIREILLDFTETMDDGSNCIEIHKYDNLVNELNKAFSLTDVGCSLKDNEIPTFDEYIMSKGYTPYNVTMYQKGDNLTSRYLLFDEYSSKYNL